MRIENPNQLTEDINQEALAEWDSKRLVYIRPVLAGDVMDELVDEDGNVDAEIPADATLFSLHTADGERIALMGDREVAFAAARQHEMDPVSVH